MSALRPSIDGQHADQCLPVLLRLQGMRRCAPPQSRRLLRVLLVRRRALSSDSGGARVGINSQLLCLIAPSDEHLSAAQILSREELVSDLVPRSAMVAGVGAGAGAGAGAAMHTLDTVILRRWASLRALLHFAPQVSQRLQVRPSPFLTIAVRIQCAGFTHLVAKWGKAFPCAGAGPAPAPAPLRARTPRSAPAREAGVRAPLLR